MSKKIYQPTRINESDMASINETPSQDIFNFDEQKESKK